MTVFKRPKDSMDDYRRAQEALRRPASAGDEPEEETAPPSEQAWRRVVPTASGAAGQAVTPGAPTDVVPATATMAATVVARDSSFNGKLKSEGSVRVEGTFDGELEASKSIYVAESARTNARLKASEVVIAGAFDGQVECDTRLHLTPTARAKGHIKTAALVVEEGAVVDCHFNMAPGKGEK